MMGDLAIRSQKISRSMTGELFEAFYSELTIWNVASQGRVLRNADSERIVPHTSSKSIAYRPILALACLRATPHLLFRYRCMWCRAPRKELSRAFRWVRGFPRISSKVGCWPDTRQAIRIFAPEHRRFSILPVPHISS